MICPATGKFCGCSGEGVCDVPYDGDDTWAECMQCKVQWEVEELDSQGLCPTCRYVQRLDHADGEVEVERRMNKRRYEN